MKVSKLLSSPSLEGMRVVAGESGIKREVHTVNMMDAPDIIPFLNRHEFLVTTAYHLKDQPHLLNELIQAMANQGCAALGIKTKRFLDSVPPSALKLANELNFPIIELPLALSLGDVINHTLRLILDSRANELTAALETHKHFTNIILQGKGIETLMKELSKIIDCSVHLVDQHLHSLSDQQHQLEIFVMREDIERDIKRISSSSPISISFSLLVSKKTYHLFPINISEKKRGFLIIEGEIPQENHLNILTIEQATNVLSFALMKEHALNTHAKNIRNDFFLHFLDGTFKLQDEIINRAKEFSLQNDCDYICVVGKVDQANPHDSFTQRQQKSDNIFEYLEEVIHQTNVNIHFFTKSDECILLFEAHQGLSPYMNILKDIQLRMTNHFNQTISFGVSNVIHSFVQVRTAYHEASESLSQGAISKRTNFIQSFQTRDILELLRLIPEKELSHFYTHAFKGFLSIKPDERESLLQTLSVYLETHCQISETAKRLFVHRNTVVYRIDKCEEILGKDLKDPETTLQLRTALRMKKLLEA